MPGKCWITIIRNHSFHKSLHSIGVFSFILDGKHSDCNIEQSFKKNTKNGLLSCHSCNTCVIRTRCSTHHRFRLINVLHRFFGAERSPVVCTSGADDKACIVLIWRNQPGFETAFWRTCFLHFQISYRIGKAFILNNQKVENKVLGRVWVGFIVPIMGQ